MKLTDKKFLLATLATMALIPNFHTKVVHAEYNAPENSSNNTVEVNDGSYTVNGTVFDYSDYFGNGDDIDAGRDSGNGNATGNIFTFNAGNINARNIWGGYSGNGSALRNTLNIYGGTFASILEGITGGAGNAANYNTINIASDVNLNFISGGIGEETSNNKVNITEGNIVVSDGFNGGGAVGETAGTAENNEINISGGTLSTPYIQGGAGRAVNNNTITISESANVTATGEITGGGGNTGTTPADGVDFSVSGNKVNIEGGTVSARAINGAAMGDNETSTGTAQNNEVNISGGNITLTDNGFISGAVSTNAARNNTVNFSNGDITGNIQGGAGENTTSGNEVNISGGSVIGNIYAGGGNGTVTNNAINISGRPDLIRARLYGYGTASSHSGNALNIYSRNISALNIYNFDSLNFYLDSDVSDGHIMLDLVDGVETDLSNTDVAAYIQGGSTLTNGDSVTLLRNTAGVSEAKSYTGTASEGISVDYDITVERSADGNSITLTLGDADEEEETPTDTEEETPTDTEEETPTETEEETPTDTGEETPTDTGEETPAETSSASNNTLTINTGNYVANGTSYTRSSTAEAIHGGNGAVSAVADNVITGGYDETGIANNNTVNINSDISVNYISGGNATASADGNKVNITAGNVQVEDGFDGAFSSDSGTSTNNEVNITGGTVNTPYIQGGAGQVANTNTITISGNANATATGEITGGSGNSSASGNKVNIEGGTVNAGAVTGAGVGSNSTSGTAQNNEVNITGGNITLTDDGFISGAVSTDAARNNTVNISGGDITGNIQGGAGENTTSGNVVNLRGGTISGNIYAGGGVGTVTNNAINIYNNPNLTQASLFGYLQPGSHSGNALNIYSKNLSVGNIYNFDNLNFYIDSGISNGDTMLTLINGSSTNLSDTDLTAYIQGGSTLTNGNSVTLLRNVSGISAAKSYKATVSEGISADYDATVTRSDDGTEITLTLGDAEPTPPEPQPEPEQPAEPEQVKIESSSGNVITVTETTYTVNGEETTHDGKIERVFGGHVAPEDNRGEHDVFGGHIETGDATDNTLNLESGTYSDEVYGGYSDSGNATNNTVNVDSGEYSQNIYGGYSNSGAASSNTINLSGGTLTGNIVGGYGTQADNNVINLYSGVNLRNARLYGGRVTSSLVSSYDVDDLVSSFDAEDVTTGTGNTLNIYSKDNVAENIGNFNALNFYIPTNVSNGDTMLTLTDSAGTDLSDVAIKAGVVSGNNNLAVGDNINLIYNSSGITTNSGTSYGMLDSGVSASYRLSFNSNENSVSAHIDSIDTKSQASLMTEVPDGAVEGMNISNDRLMNWTPPQDYEPKGSEEEETASVADTNVKVVTGAAMFGGAGAGSLKTNTGDGWVKSKITDMDLGWARSSKNPMGRLIIAPVVEYSHGTFDTYLKDRDTGREMYGNGKSTYIAGGFIARQINHNDFYYEISLRCGQNKIDSSSNDFVDSAGRPQYSAYNAKAKVFNGHIRIGKQMRLNNKNLLDVYAFYFHTHQGSMGADLTTGEHYDFESSNVGRLRVGYRLTTQISKISRIYTGLAYQYDRNSGIGATYVKANNSLNIPATGESGHSGMLELGWQIKPNRNVPWLLDLSATGFVGHHRGVTAKVKFEKEF